MNRKILMQVTAPAVLIGVALTGACLVSAWYLNRLQANLANILAQNVSSMQAAQQLEIKARGLRFHCFLCLIEPDASLLEKIQEDQQAFKEWLDQAERSAYTPGERIQVQAIREGYDQYRAEFVRLRARFKNGSPRYKFHQLAEMHPIRHVTEPCQEFLRMNEAMMEESAQESSHLTRRLHLTMLLLALGGPLGGLLSGYGIARGLSRSLYRLSVHVQDMAQQLDGGEGEGGSPPPSHSPPDVAAVQLTPEGDLHHLEKQLHHVVARVGEVAQRLQQQQNEMLRAQQLAAVGQLAASVAHEVRNPLTSIKMIVEAALRDFKPKPLTADTLRVVRGEVRRLEKTVQSFLDFARPPALQQRRRDLRAIVTGAVELVRARARQQKIEIELSLPEEPMLAEADEDQICTVLVNLFVNALDAMPDGGRLGIRLEDTPAEGIRLTVTDTGQGIRPEMMDQLFTPFASSKPTGSGLGLSISRRVIEEHGGSISASNRPEGGARFSFTLPAIVREGDHGHASGN